MICGLQKVCLRVAVDEDEGEEEGVEEEEVKLFLKYQRCLWKNIHIYFFDIMLHIQVAMMEKVTMLVVAMMEEVTMLVVAMRQVEEVIMLVLAMRQVNEEVQMCNSRKTF